MLRKYRNFIKFIMVAGIYNLLTYIVYAILIFIKSNYLLASIISFIFGVVISYVMNKKIVFQHQHERNPHQYKLMLRYFLFYLALLGFNLLLLHTFVTNLNINAYLAQIIVIMCSALISYNFMRKFIFNTK